MKLGQICGITFLKQSKIFNAIINPVFEEPMMFFEYYTNGKLHSKNEKAKFTEEMFNLNHPALKQQRNNVVWAVIGYREALGLEEVIEEIREFESYIRYVW